MLYHHSAPAVSDTQSEAYRFVQQIFKHSPLKREKFRMLQKCLPSELSGKNLCDIGGDSGVVSFKLRQLGGKWSSLDLIDEAVESIRMMVGERVFKLEAERLPLADKSMDYILVVDMLEHVKDDKAFVSEIDRVLKDSGELIVNVPNPKNGILRWFRHQIGQTDEAHGHLRPGYTGEQLTELLAPHFDITRSYSYSRLFAQLVDTVINGGLTLLKAAKGGKKGNLVTPSTLQRAKKNSLILGLVGPLLSMAIVLDTLFPFTHGGMLIVKAKRRVKF